LVDGVTNGGKGYIASELAERLRGLAPEIPVETFAIDWYLIYKQARAAVLFGETQAGHREPLRSFDLDRLFRDLLDLAKGNSVDHPLFNVLKRNRPYALNGDEKVTRLEPQGKQVVVEGMLSTLNPAVNAAANHKIFIYTARTDRLLFNIKSVLDESRVYSDAEGLLANLRSFLHYSATEDARIERSMVFADDIVVNRVPDEVLSELAARLTSLGLAADVLDFLEGEYRDYQTRPALTARGLSAPPQAGSS